MAVDLVGDIIGGTVAAEGGSILNPAIGALGILGGGFLRGLATPAPNVSSATSIAEQGGAFNVGGAGVAGGDPVSRFIGQAGPYLLVLGVVWFLTRK